MEQINEKIMKLILLPGENIWNLIIMCALWCSPCLAAPQTEALFAEEEHIKLTATLGRSATVPCGHAHATHHEDISYVIWMKDGQILERYGENSHIDGSWSRTSLRLSSAKSSDAGAYRCRLHYTDGPSKEFSIHLRVVSPSSAPVVLNERGKEVTGMAGPFDLGADMKFICKIHGGYPGMKVYWKRNGVVLTEHSAHPLSSNPLLLELSVRNLSREEFNVTYACEVINSDTSPPLVASFRMFMYLPPLSVRIIMGEGGSVVAAGRGAVASCVVVGAHPPPPIVWRLDERELYEQDHEDDIAKLVSTSSVVVLADAGTSRARLTCRALVPHAPTHAIYEDFKLLDVLFKPIVTLEFVSREQAAHVQQDDAVYLKCVVRANPAPHSSKWTFNGLSTEMGQEGESSPSEFYVGRERVSREHAGEYSCSAENQLGEQQSNVVQLHVIYPPVCHNEEQGPGSVSRDSRRLSCTVEAYPAPTTFAWAFRDGRKVTTLPEVSWKHDNLYTSSLNLVTEWDDEGSVFCQAENRAGRQREPCQYALLPSANNHTARALANGHTSWYPKIVLSGILIGSVIAFCLVQWAAMTLVLGVRRCRRQRQQDVQKERNDEQPDNISCDLNVEDETSPDLIPINNGVFHREPEFDSACSGAGQRRAQQDVMMVKYLPILKPMPPLTPTLDLENDLDSPGTFRRFPHSIGNNRHLNSAHATSCFNTTGACSGPCSETALGAHYQMIHQK